MMPGCRASTSSLDGRPLRPGCFFLLWPLFARAPRHWFLENFLLSAPGVQSVFFLLRSVGRRDLSAGPEQKKNTLGGVFFLLRPRADAHSLTAGLGGDASPSAGWCFFFLLRPRPDRGGVFFFCCGPARTLTHSRWAGAISARPGWCFFFLLRPRRVFLDNNKKCLGYYIGSKKTRRGHSKKKTPLPRFFFLLWPRAGAQRGFSFPCRSRGRSKKKNTLGGVFFFALLPASNGPAFRRGRSKKKKHPGWCFFFCSGPVPAPNGASPSPAFPRGRSKKKNTLGGVFFFAAAPRGRSLTHCGPGWRCLPLGGVVFFFCCGPARTGVVFFFLLWPSPDAHSLTVGWGDFGKARVVFFFFAAAPPGLFRQ